MSRNDTGEVATIIGAGCLFVILLIAIGGIITTLAWNAVMPQVFGLIEITWIQGYALNLLGWALFKSHYQTTSTK